MPRPHTSRTSSMSQNASFESLLERKVDADAADDRRRRPRSSQHEPALVLVGLVVREQFVGGDAVVVVAGDLAVDAIADAHHLDEVGGVGRVDGCRDGQGPELDADGGGDHESSVQVKGGDPGPPGRRPRIRSGADAAQGVRTEGVVMPVGERPGVRERGGRDRA